MEKDAHYFLVGLFVTISVTALVGFLIWLAAGPHNGGKPQRYTVYFTDSVSGLEEGASVEYMGVEVGKILKMGLSPEHPNLVKVDIEVDGATPVRSKTYATLDTRGITGLVNLELVTASDDKDPPPRREGEKYPVLYGAPSKWTKTMQDLSVITDQLRDVATKVNDFLSKKNMTSLDQSITNVEKMSQDMQGMAESIKRTSEKLDRDPSQILYRPSPRGVEIPK